MKRLVFGLLVATSAVGCASAGGTVRVYNGHVVRGAEVPADAYAFYLRGMLAEASGDLDSALAAFLLAAKQDQDDAEVWSRVGDVSCRRNASDGAADDAFSKALRIDPTYAGALAAKARCAERRGKLGVADALAWQAMQADPEAAPLDAVLLKIHARRAGVSGRVLAVALTLEHRDNAVAWSALADWGRSHDDAYLVARGLEGLVTTAPARTAPVEIGALDLLGSGHLFLAREVAASLADAPRELGVRGPRDPTVASLAVDEALARKALDVALVRATRGHVSLAEVAARALLLGDRAAALSIAQTVARADPGAGAAHMVLATLASMATENAEGAAASERRASGLRDQRDEVVSESPEICALVFADRLAQLAGVEIARSWLDRVERVPMAPNDPLGEPLLADLAARGVVAPPP
jgi:tetratricopeptide (TPR) repeat protein